MRKSIHQQYYPTTKKIHLQVKDINTLSSLLLLLRKYNFYHTQQLDELVLHSSKPSLKILL